ncbi:predicted choloylglycine hydrolase [Longilinea arvoryzae]|uniref:Predicted choloylglycine hydrolase n=1 Tax=Longilinea arvoryzae TaxID=360412 RepID=A0A0S7BH60_9CHLR|nr:C45 family peptidase [Longilinea arvoryzae]GAP12778.1 predicted choloylglycine hydrolase [Longilinea arvoryzae]
MRRVEIAGSNYELGLKYGRIVSENKLDWWWTPPGEDKLALVKACEREIAIYAPGFLEEIRGMADACQRDYDLILSNMTVTYYGQPACNVVAVTGTQCRNGRTIFARNHDYCDEDQQWVTCFDTSPRNGLRSIGFGFADPGRYDGVNEAGLAMAGAAIYYRNKPQPGLRMNVVTRWVLDNFSDTQSAVDYLKRIPHHEGISYLVADKEGCIARVEAAPERVDVAITRDGMLAAINLFQSQRMGGLELTLGQENIVYRHQKRIPAWYDERKGQIDLDAAKRLCSDHEVGLCDHGETRSEPFGTIYSWVAELGTGEIHVAHGRPCENEYKLFRLEIS